MKRFLVGVVVLFVATAAAVGAMSVTAPPTGSGTDHPAVVDPLVPVPVSPVRADLRSVVVLDGVVRPVDPRSVKSQHAGTVDRLLVRAGSTVKKDETLLTLRTARGKYRVRAPIAGVVVTVDVIKGQQVEIGNLVGVIAPSRYLAEATVEPALLYRLYAPPLEISAQLDRGPSPFPCKFVSLGAVLNGPANPLDQPVLLRCAIPSDIRVFSGIRTRLAITTAIAKDALVVPMEAVEGAADRGIVTVVDPDGSQHRREVSLGISDGIRIQILSGLTESEQFLEFPPTVSSAVPISSAQP